jgi:hypothetical protein
MWRPAVSRFGPFACALVVACWQGGAGDRGTLTNANLAPTARDLTGGYWCSIDSGGQYPKYPCVIKKVGDGLVLAKLGGSQRIRGTIKLDGNDGFTFVGELYCPWGDCTESLHGKFRPAGKGGFRGTFREDAMIVHLTPAPTSAFGGASYGGDEYGMMFGGTEYGGFGYASTPVNRIDSRGRRRP